MVKGGALTYEPGPTITGTATTADTSLTFQPLTIPVSGPPVRELGFHLSPTTDNTDSLDNITNINVLNGNVSFINCPPAMIGALLSFLGKKTEWEFNAATNHQPSFMLPLHFWRGFSAPPNGNLSVILTKNNSMGGTTAPTLQLTLGTNYQAPSNGYFSLLASQFVIGASNKNFTVQISQPGVLEYIIVPTPLNLTLFRFWDSAGKQAEFNDVQMNSLVYSQSLYGGFPIPVPYPGNYLVWRPPVPRKVVSGVTRIDVATNGSWTDGQWGFVTTFRNPKAPAPGKAA
ncbi:MAG TPA: hypothetical protein VKW04_18240 [Planctomycetota bacterium]|nr:hypothetical protein [Planctomycetota bacterium]